ncbi:hypothetical protein [Psychrobacter frigidicola]|uniref:HPP family protein n=1 Tax=Psychrobacter frigidicola TaxID=45611 RepID=UPI001918D976|nr:hypothetical protein [Psychrobacter frigidicola]
MTESSNEADSPVSKFGAALYAGWVALVITGIVGGLGFAFQQPWLFPSIGPTIFIHTVTPTHDSARPWNTFVGHGIGDDCRSGDSAAHYG